MSGNINQQDYWSQNAAYQQQYQQQQQPPIQYDQQQQSQHPQQQHAGFNFEMPGQDFSQDLSFQSFEITTGDANDPAVGPGYANQNVYGNNPYLNPGVYNAENTYAPTFPTEGVTSQKFISGGSMPGGDDFEAEPPLLEELGINPEHILQKTLTVLNPFRTPEASAVQDADFAGPLAFCLAFGGFLLLSGKVHFSYIYGIGVFGCLSMWALLTLMSTAEVSLATVVTVLGYCILPMVALSGVNIILSLQGYIGIVLTSFAIMWCSLSASKLFVTALSMDRQQPLVVYPCALLYGVFALITIF